MARTIKVAVVYHQFPHYRAPVLRALAKSQRYDYQFWASTDDFAGIKSFKGDKSVEIHELSTTETVRGYKLRGFLPLLKDKTVDAYIILGNPNIIATWLIAIIGRALGKKVLFWAHGWLRAEQPLKAFVRKIYFRLAHVLLVYGERSKVIGEAQGYPENRIHVIYNSLDHEKSFALFEELKNTTNRIKTQRLFKTPDRPLLICTARLTHLCRFDLLLIASELLKQRNMPVNILLVGDGPERPLLEKQAAQLGVDVYFFGACYDEALLAQMIFDADATVSPGKIGLTAIHSLSYGTPAFTHGDFDQQMPEVEVINPGQTGDLFQAGDANDLANTLQRWIQGNHVREEVRETCASTVAQKWTPTNQKIQIEKALDACFRETIK